MSMLRRRDPGRARGARPGRRGSRTRAGRAAAAQRRRTPRRSPRAGTRAAEDLDPPTSRARYAERNGAPMVECDCAARTSRPSSPFRAPSARSCSSRTIATSGRPRERWSICRSGTFRTRPPGDRDGTGVYHPQPWRCARSGSDEASASSSRRSTTRSRSGPSSRNCARVSSGADICDAHPELLRAAKNVGEHSRRDCPVCVGAKLRLLAYVYGDSLKENNGRVWPLDVGLSMAADRPGSWCYVVEVCTECQWNHLSEAFVARAV